MPQASHKPRYIDPDLRFRHGVRRDGVEYIVVTHPALPKVIRLSTPHDPEYNAVQTALTDWASARKVQPATIGWNQPA